MSTPEDTQGEGNPFDGHGRLSRRLKQAVDHVSHLWFPVNEQLFQRISTGLGSGVYDLDIEFLIQDIRKDFALLMYCVRELSVSAAKEGKSFPAKTSPVDILRLSGLPELRRILATDVRKISVHKLDQSTGSQVSRLRDAMIAATTAEVLSEYSHIDPLHGYGGALLRQLGLTLIAWNYPTVFRKVMNGLEAREITNVDAAFSQLLGFSPNLLGTALAYEWKLPPGAYSALDGIEIEDKAIQAVGLTLRKVCEVGEALARANAPESYPTARADWDTARDEIESKLGFEGFSLLEARAKENCEQYVKSIPETFKTVAELNAESKLHEFEDRVVCERNPYIKFMLPTLRKRLREVYAEIDGGKVSRDTLRTVLKEVVPSAGFSGGVVYTVDPGIGALIPRTKILEIEGRDLDVVQLRNNTKASSDMVLAAFRCSTPIVESLDSKGTFTAMATVLGEKQRVGVLYLETPHRVNGEDGERLLLALKAIKATLSDCLGIQ